MSHRSETRHFVVCDGCGVEHHSPESISALDARVKAGIAGWKFRPGAAGHRGKGSRKVLDICPNCELPSP